MESIRGRVWKYGDDINTDVIFAGKYTYTVTDPAEMAAHALEDLDPQFARMVQKNDVIVAGRNFGCGSSREQGATCLVHAGVGAVIARSFSRLFFRNAINAGLPLVQSAAAVEALQAGDGVTVDVAAGQVHTSRGVFDFPPLPEAVIGIFEAGGLLPYTRHSLGLDGGE
jgi:3-isopropylmalate/(R)-2-methylmalate dehydratase small subunit